MKPLIAVAALAAMACATAPEQGTGRCNADNLTDLVGREGTPALGADAQRRSGARTVRWIRPGDAVTMDYREDRLNIRLDSAGRVEGLSCG
jgi:hypothetical protein